MPKTGGAKVQAFEFNFRTVIAIGLVFGSFQILSELGQPGLGVLLASSTAFLFLMNTGYGDVLSNMLNRVAGKVSL